MTDIERAEKLLRDFLLAHKKFIESLKEAERIFNKATRLLNKADTARVRALKAVRKAQELAGK